MISPDELIGSVVKAGPRQDARAGRILLHTVQTQR